MAWENPLLATPSAQDDMRGIVADYIGSEQFTALIQSKSRRNLLRADLVTTLPISPTEGDEIDYSPQAGVYWRFRYVSAQKPYPWVFVGGGAMNHQIATDESSATATTWLDLSTDGPTLTVPFNGLYDASYGAEPYFTAAAPSSVSLGLYVAGSLLAQTDCYISAVAAVTVGATSRNVRLTTLANSIVKLRYYLYGAGPTMHFRSRWLSIFPVRVG